MDDDRTQHSLKEINLRDERVCTVIGKGDDGVVVRLTKDKSIAVKIFISKKFLEQQANQGAGGGKSFYMEISKDKALREVKSMKLLEKYHCFLKLTEPEMDFKELTTQTGNLVPNVPCVFMRYQENLFKLEDVMRYWGFKGKTESITLRTMNEMNFEHRNIIYKFMLHQLYDAFLTMQEVGIRHRDLDDCNVMVVYPSNKIIIMDFARADVPHVQGYDETENPLNITTTAMRSKGADKSGNETELWDYCISQYTNPLNIDIVNQSAANTARVPKSVELSDEFQISLLIDRITANHLYNDFEWSRGGDTKDGIIQENMILLKFIDHCHHSLPSQVRELTIVDSRLIISIPQLPIETIKHYNKAVIEARNYKKQDRFLDHPRYVIHSKAWELHMRAENFPYSI